MEHEEIRENLNKFKEKNIEEVRSYFPILKKLAGIYGLNNNDDYDEFYFFDDIKIHVKNNKIIEIYSDGKLSRINFIKKFINEYIEIAHCKSKGKNFKLSFPSPFDLNKDISEEEEKILQNFYKDKEYSIKINKQDNKFEQIISVASI